MTTKPVTTARARLGFSLIEALIVVAIIGIIATVAIPLLLSARQRSLDERARQTVRTVLSAQQAYYTSHSRYADLDELAGMPQFLDSRFEIDGNELGYGLTVEVLLFENDQRFEVLAVNPGGTHNYFANETMQVVEE
jgi:prepilin-type N-terminal cleavage/methylation domain-containing protein